MSHTNKHINTEPQLSKEAQEMIARAEIGWTKSKEDIWMEMEDKIEYPAVKLVRLNILTQMAKYAAAATIVLLVGFSATAALYTKKFETALAQEKQLTLPDNSKVRLHANSKITYKPLLWYFSRSTKLDGEASFEVKKGDKFEVVSEQAKTVVLGTQFTVTAREGVYKVDCKSGKVKVIEATQQNQAIITAGEKAELQKNAQFKVSSQTHKPATIEMEVEEIIKTNEQEKETYEKNTKPVVKVTTTPPAETQTPVSEKTIESPKHQFNNEHTNAETKRNIEELNVEKTVKPEHKQVEKQTETKETANETGRKRFRSSLNEKQIEILENKGMDKDEKRRAFMKSLSEEQRNLLREENRINTKGENIEHNKHGLGQEIKETQKGEMRQQIKNAPQNNENGNNGGGPGFENGKNGFNGGERKGQNK